ncbi:MAG: MgtC/SapB family protein [Elusimicrobia bacterium]|nr:MgtC/SapB family protein [Elusimicrobiota bacterium]
MKDLLALLPPEGLKILVVLFLCFLIGLEREEHKNEARYAFGGVRTFPLIGLLGYALSLISAGQSLPLALGLLAVGGLMALSYYHKLGTSAVSGATTEVIGLLTYALGALVQRGELWIAATLVVISLLLLELKAALEGLSRRIPPDEVLSFTKFLLLAAVILPAVPDRDFTIFQLNPYKTWLVVVAVSAVSYGGYVLQKLMKGRGGVLTSAALGGAYSSTVTTVTLAKRAKDADSPSLYAGSILAASGVMYLRLAVLVRLFNRGLADLLAPWFLLLAGLALAGGWLWTRRAEPGAGQDGAPPPPAKNPLELDAAFAFAALFVLILVVTHLALERLGSAGVYSLAGLMGVTDVDPFIMGMTEGARAGAPLAVAAVSIVVAAASNNAVKGVYAWVFADRRTGRTALALLLALAALGLLPLLFL